MLQSVNFWAFFKNRSKSALIFSSVLKKTTFGGIICNEFWNETVLSRLQLASANRVAALTSHDGILWVQGVPDVKKRYRESIENAYYRLYKGCRRDKFVIRSVADVLRTQSRFVKCVGGSACGLTPHKFYKPTLGPKYVRNRPYN